MATFLGLPEALHQHVAFHLLLLDEPNMAGIGSTSHFCRKVYASRIAEL